jgi:hypothetical protein
MKRSGIYSSDGFGSEELLTVEVKYHKVDTNFVS